MRPRPVFLASASRKTDAQATVSQLCPSHPADVDSNPDSNRGENRVSRTQ